MKSQITFMLETWEAASYDAAALCATSLKETARDCERLRMIVSSRGFSVLTLDLPSLDTKLLSLLENGFVRFEGHFCARRSKKDLRPAFLHAFWSRVCDPQGCLLSEPDPSAMMAIRQLSCFFKKIEVKCSSARVNSAIGEYYAIEREIRPPSLNWDEDELGPSDSIRFESSFGGHADSTLFGARSQDWPFRAFLRRLDRVAGILSSGLGFFDSMSVDSRENGYFKHGPGAVANLRGREYKYSFPAWSAKLEGSFPYDWCSGAPLGSSPPSGSEHPANLLAVPKTAKGPRLIASEPVEHQWCQQKIFTFLDNAFRRSLVGKFVDLRDQRASQILVSQASSDGRLSTLDLSSASDRMSARHIECLFSRNRTLLEACHASRTRWVATKLAQVDPIRLKKFAAMGSALTFPVQCLFFLSCALASAGAYDKKSINRLVGSVRVFGDDIIIPTQAYSSLMLNLTKLGLKVNETKSFSKGRFRESCGADYWGGYDITPVKPTSMWAGASSSRDSLVDLSNNLYFAGYWKASARVLAELPYRWSRSIFKVGRETPAGALSSRHASLNEGALGVVSYSGSKYPRPKWDANLHRHYVAVPISELKEERVRQDNSFALREFFTRPWSAMQPRETGTKRSVVATTATVRVEVFL